MSRRHRRACPTATKSAFGDEAAAKLTLAWVRQYGDPREKMPCRAYRCICGKWHLTSQAMAYREPGEARRVEA